MSEGNKKNQTHTGPPGYKVVEPKGPASSAGVTARVAGEIGERCRETDGSPPEGQIRIIVTAEMPRLSKESR